MLSLVGAMSQEVVSINAVERRVETNNWVPQYYIVVVKSGTTNSTVLFDSKQNVVTSAVGSNVQLTLTNTAGGDYRINRLQ